MLDYPTAEWLKEAYIGYRTVLHHLSLEGDGERVVASRALSGDPRAHQRYLARSL